MSGMGRLNDEWEIFKQFIHPPSGNFKGFAWDPLFIGIAFLVSAALIMVLFTLLWLNARPYLDAFPGVANTVVNGKSVTAQVNNLGNEYFLDTGDTIVLFFYFVLILASFISARNEQADAGTFAIGLLFLVVGIIISMPISDFAHNALTQAVLLPATNYYKNTLYLLDNLPVITGLSTFVYLVLVVTNKSRRGYGSPTGGPIVGG